MVDFQEIKKNLWWKLNEISQTKSELIESFHNIKSLNEINNLSEVIQVFINELKKICHFEISHFYIINGNFLRLIDVHFPKELEGLETIRTNLNLKVSDYGTFLNCIEEKKIINIKSEKIFHYDQFTRERFAFWKIKNSVYFPIVKKDLPALGMLILSSLNDEIPTDSILEVKELIDFFYSVFSNLIQYKNLQLNEKDAVLSKEKYQTLFKLASKMNRLFEPNRLYQLLIEELTHVFEFEMGFIQLEEEGRLPIVQGAGINSFARAALKKEVDFFSEISNAPKISTPNGPEMACCNAFINNTPIYFQDIDYLKNLPMREKDKKAISLVNNTIKSVLQVPIRDGDTPIGIIQLWSFTKTIILNENDIEMIIQLCSFIPSVLRNASMHAQLEKQKKELEEKNLLIQFRNTQFVEDLNLAQKIQLNLIPLKLPEFSQLKLSAFYQPMDQVGGDFYDFLQEPHENWLGIFISDVSGHGMPAALITSMLKTLIGTAERHWKNPRTFLKYINSKIIGQTNGNFLTAFYGLYDIDNKILTYCRASHPFPIISRNKELIELKGEGRIIGIFEEIEFEEHQVQLQSGDKLFFFTDGLVETQNHNHARFKARFHDLILLNSHSPIKQTVQVIAQNLLAHANGQHFKDDICLIGMEIF